MRHRRCPSLSILLLLLLLGVPASAQRGAQTITRNLTELVNEADVVVQGFIRSARVEPHPQLSNLMTALITVEVSDTLKGPARKTLQFRQYIWDPRDQLDAARYAKGQEVLLLLGPQSRYGLRSPVGLDQGRFQVVRDASGQVVAINGKNNAGLFAGTEHSAAAQGTQLSPRQAAMARSTTAGAVPLADLKEMIRTLARKRAQ